MGFRGFSHGFPQMFKDVWQNIDLLRLVIMILYTIFYYILLYFILLYIYTYDDILYNLVNTQPMFSTMRPLSSASASGQQQRPRAWQLRCLVEKLRKPTEKIGGNIQKHHQTILNTLNTHFNLFRGAIVCLGASILHPTFSHAINTFGVLCIHFVSYL